MRLVTVELSGKAVAGLLLNDQVIDLAAAARQCGEAVDASSVLALIQAGEPALQALKRITARAAELSALARPLGSVRLLAPIPRPTRNVFCVGRNYADHVKEGAVAQKADIKLPTVPQFFTKATHAVNAPEGDIRLDPQVSEKLDYEVELVVVIGKTGRDIKREQAFEHVFGYSVGNDVTARDLQRRHEQWFKGKSLDTTFPFGPAIVTRDEVANVQSLELTLSVNGERRQQGAVSQMIFDIPVLIEFLSAGLTLEAGDIIATGTPSGVGYAMDPPRFLANGDVVEASITGLGTLRNRVVAAGSR
jgi:2-keto-4-pentenoate hydratase/2-oxohepta-3-ene-1,7-dioic acid hydratase in catechol pathway